MKSLSSLALCLALACGASEATAAPLRMDGLAEAIAANEYPKTHAVLVMRGEEVAYEAYFGHGDAALLNDTRSATKSVTAIAAGLALAQGAVRSVKEPAFGFLRDLEPFAHDAPAKHAITIEDLLTMSSALDCNDDDDKSPGNEDRMHEQRAWTRWAVDLPLARDYRRDASGLGPWRYCTAGAVLLGQIVQRAVRQPVDTFIERQLFAPLGISQWTWPRSPTDEVMTGGGLRLTARDLGKLGAMLAQDGRWMGRQVVPAAWASAMLTPRRDAYPGLEYGYLFWHRTYNTRCGDASGWSMAGNGGNVVVVLRELRAAVVVAREAYNTRGMHQQTQALLEKHVLPALLCKGSR